MTVAVDGGLNNDNIRELQEAVNALLDGDPTGTVTLSESAADDEALLLGDGTYFKLRGDGSYAEINMGNFLDTYVDGTDAYLTLTGVVDQTSVLFEAAPAGGAYGIRVTGDGKVGFFGANPVAQATGVAVSDAAIHAALVSLGLIAA